MKIAQAPEIISLANTLGYREGCPVNSVRSHCLDKLDGLVAGRSVKNMDDLEEIVRADLKLGIHRVWSDHELDLLMSHYVENGHIIFATLKQQLSPDAYGIFIKLTHPNENEEPWVCVIDCRDDKQHKRHWTLWHEVAHCLTFTNEMELPLRRTTIEVESDPEKEPIEVLTDFIAKDLAFYAPLFDPILEKELSKTSGKLSFSLIENVRKNFSPEASFESTMNACVDRCSSPYLVMESALGLNKKEQKAKKSGDRSIKPSLRVVRTYANETARNTGVFIPPNYRIPESSIISKTHCNPAISMLEGPPKIENLGTWSSSSGRFLQNQEMRVEAKKIGGRLFTLMELRAA